MHQLLLLLGQSPFPNHAFPSRGGSSFFGGAPPFFIFFFFMIFACIIIGVIANIIGGVSRERNVFNHLDEPTARRVREAPKPNRRYIKSRCDSCGAKLKDISDISPSGDIKCSYCGTWMNILREL